jgi:hypothetical protein
MQHHHRAHVALPPSPSITASWSHAPPDGAGAVMLDLRKDFLNCNYGLACKRVVDADCFLSWNFEARTNQAALPLCP